jgi:hypothetical protein
VQIITALAALFGWFAAKRVDDILGKWVAYVTIAWQNAATNRAMEAYRQVLSEVQKDLVDSYGSWDEWRKKNGII